MKTEEDFSKYIWPGLAPYQEIDNHLFYGRADEISDLSRKILISKLIILFGPSGAGKTSLLQAGIFPVLREKKILPVTIRIDFSHQNLEVKPIIEQIRPALEQECTNQGLILSYQSSPWFNARMKQMTLWEWLRMIFLSDRDNVIWQPLFIFDQFEEIFTIGKQAKGIEEFVQQLGDAAENFLPREINQILNSSREELPLTSLEHKCKFLFSIREDYFAQLQGFRNVLPGVTVRQNYFALNRLNGNQALEAVIGPAPKGIISERVAHEIVQFVAKATENAEQEKDLLNLKLDQLVVEPSILSLVCQQLYSKRLAEGQQVITLDFVRQTKEQILKDFYDSIMTEVEKKTRTFIEDNLLDAEGFRTSEPESNFKNHQINQHDIQTLIDQRILHHIEQYGRSYFELSHDVLVPVVRKSRESRQFQEEEIKRKKEIEILRKQRRRILLVSLMFGLLFLASFVAFLYGINERNKAIKSEIQAIESKNRAVESEQKADMQKTRAETSEKTAIENEIRAVEQQKIAEEQRQVALKANQKADDSRKQALEEKDKALENEKLALVAKQDAENAKNDAILANEQSQFYLYLFNGKELANESISMQEKDTLRAMLALSAYDLITYGHENFSPDKTQVKYDGEILKSLQNALFLFEKDSVASGEIWAITSENNKTVYGRNIGQLSISELEDIDPACLPVLSTKTTLNLIVNSLVRSLAFDPATARLACGMIDGNIILIDKVNSDTPEQKIIYNHDHNRVYDLGFVPGKEWLISSSSDKKLRIWDIGLQKIVKDLNLNEPVQKFILIDPDHLVFLNSNGQILIWHLDDIDKEPQTLYTYNHLPLQTLAFSPKHKWLAVSRFGTIMILPVLSTGNSGSLSLKQFTLKHKTNITHMEFSPDNNWLVTGSADALMLWDLRDIGIKDIDKVEPIVIGNDRQLFSLAFDETSRYLFYTNGKVMKIIPMDIKDIYIRLKLKMDNKNLSDKEWKYYIKGDLVQPDLK